MLLTLDRLDLRDDSTGVPCSWTLFAHFKPDVQAAVIAVGRAVFWEYDQSNYNAIYPPKPEPQS